MNAQYKRWFKKEYNPDYSFSCDRTPIRIHHLRDGIVCEKFTDVTKEVLNSVQPQGYLAALAYTTLECEHGSRTTFYARQIVVEN